MNLPLAMHQFSVVQMSFLTELTEPAYVPNVDSFGNLLMDNTGSENSFIHNRAYIVILYVTSEQKHFANMHWAGLRLIQTHKARNAINGDSSN